MEKIKGGRMPATNATPRDCANCGRSFQPYRTYQTSCSRKCRDALGSVPESERGYEVRFACRGCGDDAVRRHTIRGGKFYFCLSCTAQAQADRAARKNENKKARPDHSARLRRENLMKSYGMTVEAHDALLALQLGVCAICGDPPKPGGVRAASRLHVDHDHATGRVRGLLCNHCNRGLGAFRDRPELLELAISYLRE